MDYSFILQVLTTLASVAGAFLSYRARDNRRAAALSEIQTEVRHIIRRLDAIEFASVRRVNKEREESA